MIYTHANWNLSYKIFFYRHIILLYMYIIRTVLTSTLIFFFLNWTKNIFKLILVKPNLLQ